MNSWVAEEVAEVEVEEKNWRHAIRVKFFEMWKTERKKNKTEKPEPVWHQDRWRLC